MQIERPQNLSPAVLHEPRNPGMPLDLDWVRRVQANTSAIERRAGRLATALGLSGALVLA